MDVIPVILKSLLPPANESIICSDLSSQQVALLQLHNSFLKKYEPTGENRNADKAALDLFIESNELCAHWEPEYDSYLSDIMIMARARLYERLYSGALQAPRISLNSALSGLRPGPGASQGTKFTDFVGKVFSSKLSTYDSGLWYYYRENIPTMWKLAENVRERQYGGYSLSPASKLTYAKKNYDISRVINTEASLDMMFQLGIGADMEDCLEDWFNINLSKQPDINRYLAKLGSIYGSHATIDLKSASDLNSEKFVKWFFPAGIFKTLDTVRAKCIELPNGDTLRLNTFSTMGNGFTFPLQTIIFSCIVEAAYLSLGLPVNNVGMIPAFSVFGDDIICVSKAYDRVINLLEWCGFRVNKTKSFNTGCFRESCGKDFFKGHDVRGIYLKRFSHETHVYSLFNRLTRWSIRNGIDLSDILLHLKGLAVFRPVPFDEQDTAGFKYPLSIAGKSPDASGLVRYKRYVSKQRRKSTIDYECNPAAVLIAAVGGYIEGTARLTCSLRSDGTMLPYHHLFKPMPVRTPVGGITLRDRPDGPPRVILKKDSTSSWDWIPHKGLTTLDYELALHGTTV